MVKADGKVVIETQMSTKGIDKGIAEIEKKMNKLEEKASKEYIDVELGGMKVSGGYNLSKEEQQYYDRLKATYEKLNLEKLQSISTENQISNTMTQEAIKQEEVASATKEVADNTKEVNDNVIQLSNGTRYVKKDMEDVDEEAKKTKNDVEEIKNSMFGMPKQVSNIISKIGKWGLALFGIRSAYNFIRSSMSILTSYDGQLKTDLEYIRYALATAIKPVVELIIMGVYKLLQIINAVSMALFKHNLFASATEQNFKKTTGHAKELRKTLAGFDEMNILGDNTTAGGGGEDFSPSVDLSQIDEQAEEMAEEVKGWFETIFEFWETGWVEAFHSVDGNWHTFFAGLGTTLEGFYTTFKGIWDTITGLIDMLVGIFTGDEDKIREGWEKFTKGLGEIIGGLITIIIGLIETVVGFVYAILAEIIGWIIHFVSDVINFIGNLINAIIDFISGIIRWIGDRINDIKNFIGGIFDKVKEVAAKIWSGVTEGLKTLVTKIGEKFDKIKEFMMKPINAFIDGIKNLWGNIKGSVEEVGNKIADKLNPGKIVDNVKKGIGSIGNGIKDFFGFAKGGVIYPPKLAVGGVINQPGRGVPLTSAIGGEHGAEGVIPLTDSQQMQLLGEAIGKYITINASITNTMNGRVISRELQKVQNNTDFAFNR